MPMVPRMIERVTGQVADQSVHPDEAVARGAAIVADLRNSEKSGTTPQTVSSHPIAISDVVSHGLGVVALNEYGRDTNSVVIPSNSKIPCQHRRQFFTVADRQTELQVQVTEGDEEALKYVKMLGSSLLRIPPYPAQAPVDVIFSCDVDGILHIEVVDVTAQRSLGEFEIERTANLERSEINQMRVAVAGLEVQ
jgi:molecular chaperone DnaK